ncbi:MAG TPA: hypothetical protein O0W81_00505 [Methanocorpusculum sp.]|nr:hypothetical protein [Methanocorpusculum sp.]
MAERILSVDKIFYNRQNIVSYTHPKDITFEADLTHEKIPIVKEDISFDTTGNYNETNETILLSLSMYSN